MACRCCGLTAAAVAFAAVLLLSLCWLLLPSSTRTSFATLPSLLSASRGTLPPPDCPPTPPLRVYMYDLPARFNVAILSPKFSRSDSASLSELPPWPATSGVGMQHNVEYWMMASVMRGGEEVVRVLDGARAEAFFVPFFSSLSFDMYGRIMKGPKSEIDRALQVELLDILRNSSFWQRSGGRDHVIPMHHPNAFRHLRDQLNASILVVSDFGRYRRKTASLNKDIVAPYVHVVNSYSQDDSLKPFEGRRILLFFRGGYVRKAEGKIRLKLVEVLNHYDDVHFENSRATEEGINASTQGMRSSKFCLHPAGDTPSSSRLFDAIVSHCVPVIVSDKIELPFEDQIDYNEFSLFFSFEESLKPDYLVNQLRNVSKERWMHMWLKLKNVSHHFEFHHPTQNGDAVNMIWRQVRNKLHAVSLAVHRSRRLKIPDWWN